MIPAIKRYKVRVTCRNRFLEGVRMCVPPPNPTPPLMFDICTRHFLMNS